MTNDFVDFFDDESQHENDERHEADSAAPPLPPERRREVQKRRRARRHKKRRNIFISLIVIVALIAAGFFGYRGIQALQQKTAAVNQKTVSAKDYTGSGYGSVDVTIEEGEGTSTVAKKLVKLKVIASESAFETAVKTAEAESSIQVGVFTLKKHMSAAAVVKIITDPTKVTGSVMIVSGDTVAEVVKRMAVVATNLTEDDFNEVINSGGDGILPDEANGSFEGWLEPGTYNVKDATSASEVLKKMVDKRISKLDSLGVASGSEREDVIKKASIIVKEVNSDNYGKVARVIENRLAKDMVLGMDSVIAYGAGVSASALTKSQLVDTSNLYNDRIYKGLPPTPISIPSDAAIKAVLNPDEGNWLYFVTVNLDTGETKFTDNEDTFNEYVKEYEAWEAANNSSN